MKKTRGRVSVYYIALSLLAICFFAQLMGENATEGSAGDLQGKVGPDDFGFTVTIDRPAYHTAFMPPDIQLGDPVYPVINMAMTVFNNSEEPVTFIETCHSFTLYNSRDEVVWGLGTCVPVEITLNPGESKSYTDSYVFKDEFSFPVEPMPEDLYTLSGEIGIYLPDSSSRRFDMVQTNSTLKGNIGFWHTYASPSTAGDMASDTSYLQEISGFDDFGVAVTIDQPAYYTTFEPPQIELGDRAFPVIHMAITIFNNTSTPVTFTQECYDFRIYNSSDDLVWGIGFCTPYELTLHPGETLTFPYVHTFKDPFAFPDEPMPEDVYTLRGEVEINFPESYSQQKNFEKFNVKVNSSIAFLHAYSR